MRTARSLTLSSLGMFVALAGFEHGLGELLQGPVSPSGVMIQSWPDAPFYQSLQGEPAMTLIPNLAVSGVVTMLVSIVFLAWAVLFVEHERGALVAFVLSILLLLLGGGFAPPVLGLILALATRAVRSPLLGWRRRSGNRLHRLLSAAWPWLLTACVAAWVTAAVGVAALDYYLEIESMALTLTIISAAFISLPAVFVSSLARDAAGMTTESAPTDRASGVV